MINFILWLYFFVRASVNIVSNEKRHYANKRHVFEELVLRVSLCALIFSLLHLPIWAMSFRFSDALRIHQVKESLMISAAFGCGS